MVEQESQRKTTRRSKTLEHALKYAGIFGGVQGLTMLVSIIRNKLATNLLGTAGYGLMAIYTSISEFVSSSSNFGIPFSSVRRLSELFESGSEEERLHFVKVTRTWSCWTALVAVLLCLVGAPLLNSWFFGHEDSHTASIMLLAPLVAAMSITGGEISILKGLRRLKRVALISIFAAVAALCFTIPFFWTMGLEGIILALNVSTIAVMIIHFIFTLPAYPWHIAPFSRDILMEGWKLIRIGIPYVLAAMAGSGTTMALSALMKRFGSIDDVGLYRVGFGLMATYAGIVYAAFDADYFPRLSSVNNNAARRNLLINQQIRVCILLISPLLIALMTAMPLIIRILSSEDFLPVTGMAITAAFYMFLRGITLPISYTALACGHSKFYLLMELLYDMASLAIIMGSYLQWGLTGAGIGLSLSALFDMLLIGGFYAWRYGVRITLSTIRLSVGQALLLAVTMAAALTLPELWRYAVGVPLFAVSSCLSYKLLAAETAIISQLRNRFRKCPKSPSS